MDVVRLRGGYLMGRRALRSGDLVECKGTGWVGTKMYSPACTAMYSTVKHGLELGSFHFGLYICTRIEKMSTGQQYSVALVLCSETGQLGWVTAKFLKKVE